MTLQVIGAGLARTGTTSLKLALEQLLARPCYHMLDVFENPHQIAVWHDAIRGTPPAWNVFFNSYDAAVDLPASAFWRELTAANPQALIILSVRDTPEQWWDSVSATILDPSRPPPAPGTQLAEYVAMATDLWEVRLGAGDMSDKKAMIAAYQRHNDEVRAQAPRERFLEWRPADGWGPLAASLGLPTPTQPFPHVNTREQFGVPAFGQTPAAGLPVTQPAQPDAG